MNSNNEHTSTYDENKVKMLLINKENKDTINKTAITFDIKANDLINASLKTC